MPSGPGALGSNSSLIIFKDSASSKLNSLFVPPGLGESYKPDGGDSNESFDSEFIDTSFVDSFVFQLEVETDQDGNMVKYFKG